MMSIRLAPGERVFIDLTSPLSALFFPLLEILTVTGLAWMAIGYLDRPELSGTYDPKIRNLIVLMWAGVVVFRLVTKIVTLRRRRIIVTEHRLLLREAGWTSSIFSAPIEQVQAVDRHRNTIRLMLRGQQRAFSMTHVPQARRVFAVLEDLIHR
ncbi:MULTISPECIES: hypothetical protein [unclassified Corynebacterium]|uniref:hypothetical protein n=1 Tax=unclassified Corynebacterium TaxID=2624378 RepID=UPI00216885B4|nr:MULTISPECIES: hypothetical protein [unclassified Corynebacterium]MCS4491483.1 hypothetical protein [Corynebacterium sp. ES2715-CONJ3]MCS4531417.1 hypothetical protein [Corynebacterium sp. ES2730-CONJ]